MDWLIFVARWLAIIFGTPAFFWFFHYMVGGSKSYWEFTKDFIGTTLAVMSAIVRLSRSANREDFYRDN